MSAKEGTEHFKASVSSQKVVHSVLGSGSVRSDGSRASPSEALQPPPLRLPLGTLLALVVLLLVLICLSAAPLAGDKEGWFYFQQDNLESNYLRNLNLVPWDHYIDVGYAWHTNAVRKYAAERQWVLAGQKMTEYAKIWANFKHGDAAQLVGGYLAAMLAASCLMAGVYLAMLVRCGVLLQRQRAMATGAPGELRQAIISSKRLIRPLGPWLWPAALTIMVVLAALLVAFYLLVTASFNYQTSQLAPGVLCPLSPSWAFWTALSTIFCWLIVLVLSGIEAWMQHEAEEDYKAWLAAVQHRHTGLPPTRSHGPTSLRSI